ncbi:MAG: cyclic pyranopterin monophosphate synthase MoaC [Actinomyces succiniciruminis]|nr:cyclic pyranopterin monophosphate synthase MoaC [Actinomyces succiniciruminis]
MRLFHRKPAPARDETPADGPEPGAPEDSFTPAGPPSGHSLRLAHLDESGAAHMVDVSAKHPTVRMATASAFVACSPTIVAALRENAVPKGDALAVARIAGIAAAKRVPDLLPLAHVIGVHACSVDLRIEAGGVRIETTVRTADRTGVEMEALTAATVAGLALVDMVKGVDRGVALREAKVTSKSGGSSGDWVRPEDDSGADDAWRTRA